jgi:anti-anti-sigma regulatory factor
MSMPDYVQPNKPLLLIEAFEPLRTYRLVGEMDLSNSSWVGAALDRNATVPGDLTLDLAQLKFLDGSGRLALARLAGKLGRGYRLIVHNPTESVARLLSSPSFDPVPNLVVDPADWPEAGSSEARTLAQGTGVTSHMWGVLGLAQSLMPMADEVSFTVREGDRLTTPVATGDDAFECDSVQYQLNDGPCVRAAQRGIAEHIELGEGGEHLLPFLETAMARGISAVLSIPVLAEPPKPVGALNLYSRAPGAFPAVEVPKAQVLAIRAARIFNPATQ